MKLIVHILAIAALLTPVVAVQAETVYRVGSDAKVGSDQVVKNDLYISAGIFERTLISGSVMGDVYTLGSAITIDGPVGADIFAVGGDVTVHGTTTDDVRVVGGDVMIDGAVGGDVFVLAGTVTVTDGAHIAGDMLVFAGNVDIAGPVDGSIFGSAERFRINSTIGGDIEVRVPTRLTLGEDAVIAGSISFESRNDMARAQSSVVEGEIQQQKVTVVDEEEPLRAALTPLFVLLFSALALYLLFKPQLQDMAQDIYAHPLVTGGIGVAAVFAGPLVALVLILTILAAPLGIAVGGVLALLFAFGFVLAGIVFGMYAARWLFGIETLELPVLIGGVVVLYAIMYVPVIGMIIFSVAYLVAIGATVRFFTRKLV